MTAYAAPLEEMRFVLQEVAGLAAVRALPGYGEADDALVDAVLAEASRFGSEVLAPLNAAGDRQGCRIENAVVRVPDGFVDAYQAFVDGGWNGLAFPADYGGQGLPGLLATSVAEIWSGANMAFALCPLLTQSAASLLLHHGDARMRARYLPKLVSGEWTGTMLLTEPQAGSDLGQVRTRAQPEGDHYRLSGQKIYITYGEHDMTPNILHAVLARTPGSPPGPKGLSLFLVPKVLPDDDGRPGQRNDLRCVSIERKLGIHASPTAVIAFGDGGGAIGFIIGEEGRGLDLMFTMMNHARLSVGLQGVSMADRAYQEARAYAFERVQGRPIGAGREQAAVPIVQHPDVQRMLLTMKARAEAGRALAYLTAAYLDAARQHADEAVRRRHQRLVDLLIPVVKAWCTDVGISNADAAIQVHGGIGYIEESGIPQLYRDARILAIYEGTNGIQAMDLVSRKVAGDGGAAMGELLERIAATEAELAEARDDADLDAIGHRLAVARADLATATDWLLATYPADPRRVAAGAMHYLRVVGNVAGGWLLAKGALAAHAHLADGNGHTGFFVGKRKTARFFADSHLPEAAALREAFMAAGNALGDLDPDSHL